MLEGSLHSSDSLSYRRFVIGFILSVKYERMNGVIGGWWKRTAWVWDSLICWRQCIKILDDCSAKNYSSRVWSDDTVDDTDCSEVKV